MTVCDFYGYLNRSIRKLHLLFESFDALTKKKSVLSLKVRTYELYCVFFFIKMNNRALDFPREKDGARVQMRLSYSPAAQFFLFLVQWTDCQLAGALGLLRVLIYMVLSPLFYYIHHTVLCDCLINLLSYVFGSDLC